MQKIRCCICNRVLENHIILLGNINIIVMKKINGKTQPFRTHPKVCKDCINYFNVSKKLKENSKCKN